jgi:hypothetical protein
MKRLAFGHYRHQNGVIYDPTSMPNGPGMKYKNWATKYAVYDIDGLKPRSKWTRF